MKKNIEDYLFHKKDFLSKDFCKSTIEKLKVCEWEGHDFTGYEANDPEHGFGWQREVKSKHELEPEFIGFTSPAWYEDLAQANNFIIKELSSAFT